MILFITALPMAEFLLIRGHKLLLQFTPLRTHYLYQTEKQLINGLSKLAAERIKMSYAHIKPESCRKISSQVVKTELGGI